MARSCAPGPVSRSPCPIFCLLWFVPNRQQKAADLQKSFCHTCLLPLPQNSGYIAAGVQNADDFERFGFRTVDNCGL